MSFRNIGILDGFLVCLDELGFKAPTPIQKQAIPALLGGGSIFAVARTGSGKTLAYGLPLLQKVHLIEQAEGRIEKTRRPRGLVLSSTRELVDQTTRALKRVSHGVPSKIRCVYGGMLESDIKRQLAQPVDVLVGNPTRVASMVREKALDLSDLRVLVVDEADTLLSPGQRPDLEFLLNQPGQFQRCYFSATLPESMRQIIVARPEKPSVLLSKDAHAAPTSLKIQNLQVKADERLDAAHDLLLELPVKERGILFTNRRESAASVAEALRQKGHSLQAIHGAMLPRERQAALKAFREGNGRFLVTTELGGRGLHIDDLSWVMNYELPERPSEYLHRIGRVGRASGPTSGRVVNLVTAADHELLKHIKRLAEGAKLDTGEPLRGVRKREAPKNPDYKKPKEDKTPTRGEVEKAGGRRGRVRSRRPAGRR